MYRCLRLSLPMLLPPAQLARKLIDLANQSNDFPNFWNIRLHGERKSITENRNMCAKGRGKQASGGGGWEGGRPRRGEKC